MTGPEPGVPPSQAFVAALAEGHPEFLVALDVDGRILFWNRGAEVMLGHTAAEARGKCFVRLVVPAAQHEAAWERIRKTLAAGGFAYETERLTKDAVLVHVEGVSARHADPDTGKPFLTLTERDVTRRKYEGEARLLEAKFKGLLEAAPDAMVIVNQDGLILLVNSHVEELFGHSRGDLIGRPIETLVPPRFRPKHPAHRGGYFKDPKPRHMGAGLDLSALRKDGTEFPAEISLSPMDTELGVMVTAAIRDVTQRRRIESKFRGLLEAAPDAMVIVNKKGIIELVNGQAEKLFGYTREELLGKPMEILVPARYRERHPGHRGAFFASPGTRPMGAGLDLAGLRKDGTEFPAEISLAPLETDEGRLVSAAVRDISDRKRLEEIRRGELEERNLRIEEANRLKSEFLANMSHELRTPLNAVIGFTELMLHGKVPKEDHPEYLGDILKSARHLLQLINDVLDLAKVESGKMEFRPEPIHLEALVGEIRDVLRGLAAKKRLRFDVAIDAEVQDVVLDPSKLKQVLYNYLSNAVKFSPEEGLISIRVVPAGPDLFRLEVEDRGIGIAAEDIPRLFVEFQQLDAGTAKKFQGTGLGLALTKRIVEAQGGRVDVASVAGKGSLFSAELPRKVPLGR